jgi:hypothetical protein
VLPPGSKLTSANEIPCQSFDCPNPDVPVVAEEIDPALRRSKDRRPGQARDRLVRQTACGSDPSALSHPQSTAAFASTTPRASPSHRSSPTNVSEVRWPSSAVAYYASLGVTVERVMTDNGSCYKSFTFRNACRRLGLKHIRTRPYTPKTNGKAERFVQTCLARMGLRPRLPQFKAARPGTALLPPPLQLASSSCQYQRQAHLSADSV